MVEVPTLPEARLKEIFRGYLTDRGVRSEPIPVTLSRTPDFWLEHGNRRILNELKAPELHIDAEFGVYKWKTTLQKLQDHCRTAVKQFCAEDPAHEHPRLLVFVSCHFQLNLFSLREAIQGGVLNADGTWLTDFRTTDAYRRWFESFGEIDAILWLQLNVEREELFQAGYFVQQGSPHVEAVGSLFNALRARSVGDSDQLIVITRE